MARKRQHDRESAACFELLLILLIYFGGNYGRQRIDRILMSRSALWPGIFSLTVVFGAYGTEIFRGAIQSIPRGRDRGRVVIGLAPRQTWLLVILPQMARIALSGALNLGSP